MREFLLHSRTGFTDGKFDSLVDAGRLDIVYQCALMSLFKAAAHRHDVVFHAILNGPPRPPLHMEISGNDLQDARIDERSWQGILRKVLGGKQHPGIKIDRTPFQKLIKQKDEAGYKIFVLNNRGTSLGEQEFTENVLFVLGDHIGLPKNDELFALRYGEKLSLGREKYLAASCIDILNYYLDQR